MFGDLLVLCVGIHFPEAWVVCAAHSAYLGVSSSVWCCLTLAARTCSQRPIPCSMPAVANALILGVLVVLSICHQCSASKRFADPEARAYENYICHSPFKRRTDSRFTNN
ncbi:hypothetical protein BV25DRAFT_1040942 [Artomyces pyxidatus]|uniref:Uncharacterized protein n=1 Tax=Artomyces pyxidatus TaxID=48021 RepID=A0ACB8SUU2_9AGAM|nr:hypothetical protein BV25DRAFT_1040942 [Artomyces pyxidatus]